MSEAVSLESRESSWDLYEGVKEKTNQLTTLFLDFVLPKNVVTGSRELHFIPLFVEKFVGAALYRSYILQSGGAVPLKYEHYEKVVKEVGEELAAHSPRSGMNFEFTVVKDWNINAWCLPGGKIAMNLGILYEMENDESSYNGYKPTFKEKVAAVMSREITHATARHFGRAMEFRILMAAAIKTINYGLNYFIVTHYDQKIHNAQKNNDDKQVIDKLVSEKLTAIEKTQKLFDFFANLSVSGLGKCGSRTHELEADKYGMFLLHEAKINPQAAVWLQQFFLKQKPRASGGWFEWISHLTSTHPSSHERLETNIKTLEELQKQ